MSTNVPTISVTSDVYRQHHHTSSSSDSEDNSDSDSNDMNYNQNLEGAVTDVEDFDSQADVERPRPRKLSKNNVAIPKTQGDVTDVEDYNDSEADDDDDKSVIYPELKLSLQEFLQHDVQEHLSTSNGVKEMVEHKSGNFLNAQNLNGLSDYLTDCEDYNTDSELENNCEKSVCVDLNEAFVEQGRVNIADATVTSKDQEDSDYDYDDVSVVSDISDMASAISDAADHAHGLSEDEMLEISGNEEICQISCSDSGSLGDNENISDDDLPSSISLPPIDVTFIQPTNRSKRNETFYNEAPEKNHCSKKMFLTIGKNINEEVLTDIERFDDSVAEGDDDDSFDADDENQRPIPQAVILAVGDDGGCQTDCEDLIYDDVSESVVSGHVSDLSVDPSALPHPQREVIMLQENKFGDTITNVMPMDKEYLFGMYTTLKDECFTDIEEYSCTEDFDIQVSAADPRSPSPLPNSAQVEPDVTVSNEMLKPQHSKRLEIISNAESVTDVEEIYMAGTNSRRKKFKSRSIGKGKSKFLEPPKVQEDGGTDIEDMDLSDSVLPAAMKCVKKPEQNNEVSHLNDDKVTDVEDITADDASSVSDVELPQIDVSTTNLQDYETSSKNVTVASETCGSVKCTEHNRNIKTRHLNTSRDCGLSNNNQQEQTDVEDVQLPSDSEECMYNTDATVECISHQFNEMLSESSTTVHEKCCNSFNVDAEKLHIKGMPRESHTDIEYVESDESVARGSK